jgi:DNA-binding CsgD family transcriptional regulator
MQNTEAIEWGQQALELGDALGDRAVQANALNTIGSARWFAGDAEGESLLLRSLQISLEDNRDDDVARAYTNLSGAAKASLELAKSRDYLDQGIAYCIQHDLDSSRMCMLSDRVATLLDLGSWEVAELQALELLDRLVLSRITRIPAVIVVALARARRGEPEGWELLDEALAHAVQTQESQFLCPVAAARAEVRWLAGDRHLVAEEVRAAYELAVEVGDAWYTGQLGVWLWRAGELSALPEVPELSTDVPAPFRLQVSGDPRAASEAWHELGFPYEAAMALADSSAEADLRAAIAQFDPLGARPMIAMTAARLRELGVGNIPRGARASTRANPAGLTGRELEVLALLEEGLRNAEIAGRLYLSEKTVAHHVSAVLAKLEVGSRGEAARKARALLAAAP